MLKIRHLKNAPIVEALIDFRATLPSQFNPEEFSSLSKVLSDDYPKNEPRRIITGSFRIEKGVPVVKPPEGKFHGYIFKSEDEKNVAQFRIDGFTFSRLNPYTEWEKVFEEAKKLWELYYSIASPETIPRIAVRYINKLALPLPIGDFEEYFTEPPRIPSALPQGVIEFFSRIVIHEEEIIANMVMALQSQPKSDHIEIIFDIDTYKNKPSGFDKDEMWPVFERLRDFKNRIFFESITEKTVRLYE